MNERQIQNGIFEGWRSSMKLMLPNYTPRGWWECDLFAVTNAGYFHEYEIKLTVADFKKDAKKAKHHLEPYREEGNPHMRWRRANTVKYDRMAASDPNGPTCFWYVVPDDMIGPDDVPEWAGLLYASCPRRRVRLRKIKPAPRQHATKIDQRIIDHARSVTYYRFWKELSINVGHQLRAKQEREKIK